MVSNGGSHVRELAIDGEGKPVFAFLYYIFFYLSIFAFDPHPKVPRAYLCI